MNFENACILVQLDNNETEWFNLNDYSTYEDLLEDYLSNPLRLYGYPYVVDYEDVHSHFIEKNQLNPEFFEVLEVYNKLTVRDQPAYIIWLNNDPSVWSEEAFYESYRGEWESMLDFAMHMMHECHTIPEFLERYIDYEKFADDLSYDYWEEEGYIFGNY